MLKVILTVLYGAVLIPASVTGRLLGRDSLLLRRPRRDSYWLAKAPVSDVQSYFSPGSARDGNGTSQETPVAMAGWLTPVYVALSKALAPRRRPSGETATSAVPSAATREQGIPDEIYTLW